MNRVVVLLVGSALLGAVYLHASLNKAPEIEADIQARTESELANISMSNVIVVVDGRDVRLSGTVISDSHAVLAEETARDTRGVRAVYSEVRVDKPEEVEEEQEVESDSGDHTGAFIPEAGEPYATSLCHEDNVVRLSGNVTDNTERAAYENRARQLFGPTIIEQRLVVRGSAPKHRRTLMNRAMEELAQLDSGCVEIVDQHLTLSGAVRSVPAIEEISARVKSASPPGFKVRYDLATPSLSEQASQCQDAFNEKLGSGDLVLFESDSDAIHADGRELLDELIEIGKLCPAVGVLVTGHTDSQGDRQYNLKLSSRRANAVVEYLVNQGKNPNRLIPLGYGDSQPIADNSTEEGRRINRRIEFRVHENIL